MVYSPKKTVDLWEIYLNMLETMTSIGMNTGHASNVPFIEQIKCISVVVGVCDKNPVSVGELVRMQRNDPETNTLSLVRALFSGSRLLLDEFFKRIDFCVYGNSVKPSAEDYEESKQAFLMALAAHVSMRAEISYNQKKDGKHENRGTAIIYMDFIKHIRTEFSQVEARFVGDQEPLRLREKMDSFKVKFASSDMLPVMGTLLFDAIEAEVNFCLSQVGGLEASSRVLPGLGITPGAPRKDAVNLRSLKYFYEGLNDIQKKQLVSELLLAVTLQAGYCYSKKDETRFFWQQKQGRRASLSALADNSMYKSRGKIIGDDSSMGSKNIARSRRRDDCFIPDGDVPDASFTP